MMKILVETKRVKLPARILTNISIKTMLGTVSQATTVEKKRMKTLLNIQTVKNQTMINLMNV